MKAYKGFNHDMTCRGFQYEEGKTYETDEAEVCECGFHACEMPADVFNFYGFNDSTYDDVFHEVESDGEIDNNWFYGKMASTKITIGKEMSVFQILSQQYSVLAQMSLDVVPGCKRSFEHRAVLCSSGNADKYVVTGGSCCISAINNENYYTLAMAAGEKSLASAISYNCPRAFTIGVDDIAASIGFKSMSIAAGNSSIAAVAGDLSKSMCTSDQSISANTAHGGEARNSGDFGVAVASGEHCTSISTGFNGISISSGHLGSAKTSSLYGIAIAGGGSYESVAEHSTSVAIVNGNYVCGKGVLGSHIIFIFRKGTSKTYVKTIHITGKKYKPNVHYFIDHEGNIHEWNGGEKEWRGK